MTSESVLDNNDRDSSQELRESLEIMDKEGLTKARSEAIQDLVKAGIAHPLAQEVTQEKSPYDVFRSSPVKEISIAETGITVRVEAYDLGQYAFSPKFIATVTSTTAEGTPTEVRELDSYDKPLRGNHSFRDMQAVVEDVVAMRTMQEQLSAGVPSPKSQTSQS